MKNTEPTGGSSEKRSRLKLWLITSSVHDGEHEYWQTTTIEARDAVSAERKWARENEFKARERYRCRVYESKDAFDYRYYEVEAIEEACPCCHGTGEKGK